MSIRRRDFLRGAGAFIVTAKLAGCGDNNKGTPDAAGDDRPPSGTFLFPQGLASGDPRTTSVVLWTRVVNASPSSQPIDVRVEVFTGESTEGTAVVDQLVQATIASDHTVRVLVQQLAPDTFYTYKFTAGRDSITGRTRTAPTKAPTCRSTSRGSRARTTPPATSPPTAR